MFTLSALNRLLYGMCEPATRNTWKAFDDILSLQFSFHMYEDDSAVNRETNIAAGIIGMPFIYARSVSFDCTSLIYRVVRICIVSKLSQRVELITY